MGQLANWQQLKPKVIPRQVCWRIVPNSWRSNTETAWTGWRWGAVSTGERGLRRS